MHQELTPRQIVAELDKYIIGQDEAKKSVAIALRNRWRRMNAPEEMREEIMPNNIVMIGPTGVGKTEIARRLARLRAASTAGPTSSTPRAEAGAGPTSRPAVDTSGTSSRSAS